jgi:hypothetical protein
MNEKVLLLRSVLLESTYYKVRGLRPSPRQGQQAPASPRSMPARPRQGCAQALARDSKPSQVPAQKVLHAKAVLDQFST